MLGTGHEWPGKVAGEQVRSSDTFPKAFIAKQRLFSAVFCKVPLAVFFRPGNKTEEAVPLGSLILVLVVRLSQASP